MSKQKGRPFSMFQGRCPVLVPSSWVSDPEKVRWAYDPNVQYVDFTPNGGKAFSFSIENGGVPGNIEPVYQEIDPVTITGWGDVKKGGPYVESYQAMEIFGASSKFIDLVPPEPDDGVRVFPPAILAARDIYSRATEPVSYDIDTSTPVLYWFKPDSFGGCGFFTACVRATNGKAVIASIGIDARGWHYAEAFGKWGEGAQEISYEEYVQQFPDARMNPDNIWDLYERRLQGRDEAWVRQSQASMEIFTVEVKPGQTYSIQ